MDHGMRKYFKSVAARSASTMNASSPLSHASRSGCLAPTDTYACQKADEREKRATVCTVK